MKKQLPLLLLLAVFALAALLANACKKVQENTVEVQLTSGRWQLASIIRYNYIGSTNTSNDTLNTTCLKTQLFAFNVDKTCSYQNYSCIDQSVKGSWRLSDDKLTLYSGIKCADTTSTGFSTPFSAAQIVTLGQYAFVVQTGDLSSNYQGNQIRHIWRYGFVHVQ